ncbi:MAG: hypothetical protein Q9195_000630 [Heterodermia aff. obscurata]
MVSTKTFKAKGAKVSTAALAASAETRTTQKSSVFKALFSPSHFQLSLFASVIQGLDGQHLRIHDVDTARLRCEHAITSNATINCLDWGHYGENHSDRYHQESNKKRKRSAQSNGSFPDNTNVVLAFGTSDSEILMLSPTESKIVGNLRGEHTQGIRDFKFVDAGANGEGWSVGGDGKLVQWDLRKPQSLRSFNAPTSSIATLCPLQKALLCASHTTYLIDPESSAPPLSFSTSSYPVHTIKARSSQEVNTSSFLTASESDRHINVFSVASRKLIGTLQLGAEIISISLSPPTKDMRSRQGSHEPADRLLFPKQTLAAVNKEGIIVIFPSPFDFALDPAKGFHSLKARGQQSTRKPQAFVKITRPDSSTHVPILDCTFNQDDLVMAWTEGGVNLVFNRVKWRDEDTGKLLLQGTSELVRTKSGTGVSAVVMNGVKDMGRNHVDESHTVVSGGQGTGGLLSGANPSSAIDISSAEEESEYSEEEEEENENENENGGGEGKEEEKGKAIESQPISQDAVPLDEDITMEDASSQADAEAGASEKPEAPEDAGEPSFGEMIRANALDTIDVQANLTSPNARAIATTGERSLQPPSGMSLGTVLTQSLRTNDVDLLETCFHVRELTIVRASIERIDSSLATILLDKLAERLHNRPGRAGSLMVWIQWILIAHGGYLASQPQLMKKLASLYRVVGERANSLQPLLALKGKLDMLEAQMNFRKTMQARSSANALDEDDEEGVIYVEGQDDSESEDDGPAPNRAVSRDLANASLRDEESGIEESGAEEEVEDDMSTKANGVDPESEDDDSASEDEGMIDDEADSTDSDSADERSEDEIDYDDVDSLSESISEPDDQPPAKRSIKTKMVNGLGNKSR